MSESEALIQLVNNLDGNLEQVPEAAWQVLARRMADAPPVSLEETIAELIEEAA